MSSNVTAVSYGLKLSLPDIQRLRSLLTAAGLGVGAETRTGDARFEVYAVDCALDSVQGASLDASRGASQAGGADSRQTPDGTDGLPTPPQPPRLRKPVWTVRAVRWRPPASRASTRRWFRQHCAARPGSSSSWTWTPPSSSRK